VGKIEIIKILTAEDLTGEIVEVLVVESHLLVMTLTTLMNLILKTIMVDFIVRIGVVLTEANMLGLLAIVEALKEIIGEVLMEEIVEGIAEYLLETIPEVSKEEIVGALLEEIAVDLNWEIGVDLNWEIAVDLKEEIAVDLKGEIGVDLKEEIAVDLKWEIVEVLEEIAVILMEGIEEVLVVTVIEVVSVEITVVSMETVEDFHGVDEEDHLGVEVVLLEVVENLRKVLEDVGPFEAVGEDLLQILSFEVLHILAEVVHLAEELLSTAGEALGGSRSLMEEEVLEAEEEQLGLTSLLLGSVEEDKTKGDEEGVLLKTVTQGDLLLLLLENFVKIRLTNL